MKTFLKTTSAILFTVLLVGCSGASEQPKAPVNTDDHHQGETNVAPHDDSMQKMMDDHHEGESDVMPHGHDEEDTSMQKMMDDHHEGEENVEPHGHDDADTKLPPSRSRLEGANDDHHAGEENVAPHND